MPYRIKALDLLQTEDIIPCEPTSNLSQALAKLTSSHDAVFVVGKKQNLLGVISPYYVLIQGNYPPTTKVENCLYSPPKLKESTALPDIVRNMIESKVYYLPVYSQNGSWSGIVTAPGGVGKLLKNQSLVEKPELKKRFFLITLKKT